MENLKSKPRSDQVSKQERVIVESLSQRVNELELDKLELVDQLQAAQQQLQALQQLESFNNSDQLQKALQAYQRKHAV